MSRAYLEMNEVQQLEAAATYLRDKLLIRLLFHLGLPYKRGPGA